ncbi:glycosyltransferase family 39 protein [Mucilaginibacter daejeonensis]|uniref:ArnT family glycosyltransferase n=1 Tax=Mucilaginibacter daejeonensis TaxID=398049 RepID=UPI001D17A668|nr:glycosyltransferase family 39 protein [Mucilaginibacter daejeonensis]UEG51956.1 glycosyltransferase family 39 protein [Mucilaginibacter daejeonensis]
MQSILSSRAWLGLFLALFVAYFLGLFVPLMNEDASHHANIALHMVQTHNYLNLVDDNGLDYLDKPHLHFWLSALSFNIFGVNTIAYKIPALLATLLGLFSTYKLTKRLYDHETGLLATIIYASAQAQFLANNDVRMDALLTASIIFATWQLIELSQSGRWFNYVLAPLGLAMAFTTKGMIGLVMPLVALFFMLIYQRNWKMMFNVRWLAVAVLFCLFIAPCVYAYYQQYDMHPEKVVRGMKNVSGVKFILWKQNTERFDGKSWGTGHKDYFFFFHTLLWAFLPFCLLTYVAFFKRIVFFWKTKFSFVEGYEALSAGTILVIFIIISMAGYQLPHYLNILFPFFAIITASLLTKAYQQAEQGEIKIYLRIQYFVIGAIAVILVLLNFWCFPLTFWWVIVPAVVLLLVLVRVLFTQRQQLNKLVMVSVLMAALTNVLLNGSVYQHLLNYQGGIGLAQVVNRQHIPKEKISNYVLHSSAFNFYTQHITPFASVNGIKRRLDKGEDVWIFTSEEKRPELVQGGLIFGREYIDVEYGITRLTKDFLNPRTRHDVVTTDRLIHITGYRK